MWRVDSLEKTGWHHGLDGHESEWTPGAGDGQGGLVCCDSWGLKESDTTERLNWTELNVIIMTTQIWEPIIPGSVCVDAAHIEVSMLSRHEILHSSLNCSPDSSLELCSAMTNPPSLVSLDNSFYTFLHCIYHICNLTICLKVMGCESGSFNKVSKH